MSTQDNLQAAFAGESQANRTYLAFAAKAEAEGRPQIARLFRAAAAAETVHAHSHLRVMKGVGDTRANLEAAIAGEGHNAAVRTFRNAMAVEKVHHDLYSKALETLQKGEDLPASAIYVCDGCGHTVVGEPPDRCPVCGAPRAKFKEVP